MYGIDIMIIKTNFFYLDLLNVYNEKTKLYENVIPLSATFLSRTFPAGLPQLIITYFNGLKVFFYYRLLNLTELCVSLLEIT